MSIPRLLFRLATRLLAVTGAVWMAVTLLPIFDPWLRVLSGPWNPPKGDILIVLGNEMAQDRIIGLESYWRCVYAVTAWRGGGISRVVVSGGSPLAEALRDFIVAAGVPANAILLESRSRTTREQALFTAALLQNEPGNKILLTSDFHMYRAWRSFQKAGLSVLPCPFPDAAKRANAWQYRQAVFYELLMETSKIGWYRFQGWI